MPYKYMFLMRSKINVHKPRGFPKQCKMDKMLINSSFIKMRPVSYTSLPLSF